MMANLGLTVSTALSLTDVTRITPHAEFHFRHSELQRQTANSVNHCPSAEVLRYDAPFSIISNHYDAESGSRHQQANLRYFR